MLNPSSGEKGQSLAVAPPVKDSAEVQAVQGDSLHAVVLFPESGEASASAPRQSLSREVEQGLMLFEYLALRRGGEQMADEPTRSKPLDFALAKMRDQISVFCPSANSISI